MCGIVGFQSCSDIPLSVIEQNWDRGKYSLGWYNLNTKRYNKKLLQDTSHSDVENLYKSGDTLLMQFRQPTSTGRVDWVDKENYPLESNSYYLFGNGVINATFYKGIKDEDNNNDLYYICKGIDNKGFDFLKEVEGCFALSIVEKKSNRVFLIRKDYPLFYTEKAYSSVKFKGSQLLPHGVLYEWTKGPIRDLKLESVYI